MNDACTTDACQRTEASAALDSDQVHARN
uniref:Uncharacterized protein n=1 Tax=Arundo donax TaxID=35708 RepID=A0A0A9A8U2_ARUDO